MAFKQANKPRLMALLEREIYDYLTPPVTQRKADNHTIDSLFIEYTAIRNNQFPDHLRRLRYAFRHFLTADLSINNIDEIRDHINNNIAATTLSINNSRKILQALQRFFRFAVDEGYIERNPIINTMIPSAVKPDKKIFSPEEVEQIIEYFADKKPELALLIKFISITGARISETINLRWEDINDTRILIHGKGNKDRIFPIKPFPELKQVLNDLRLFDNDGKVFQWDAVTNLQIHLRNACTKLGFREEKKSFHSIRKMRENQLIIEYGLDMNITAELMGHTRRVQEEHYLDVMKEETLTQKIIEQINNG